MPCKFQGEFDIHMEQPRARQTDFEVRPRGAGLWQRLKKPDPDFVRDAFYDLINLGDISDDTDIVVPVVAGKLRFGSGIECGSGLYIVPDLTHQDLSEIVPVHSNGVLQSFVGEIVDQVKDYAKADGFDPNRLPQTEKQAKRMGMKQRHILPPWMLDRTLVASIEKWIRENALTHVPDLRDLHHGEEEAGRLATRLFLETGWNPLCDGRVPPRAVREHSVIGDIYKDFKLAQEKAGGVDEWKLAGAGLVSEYLLNNGSEETSAITAPWITALGFDSVPELKMNGEDMDAVHAIIQRKLRGEPFDKVLEDHDYQYGYGGRQVCPQTVLDTANRVWANMVERNGTVEGEERDEMPQRTIPGLYLMQDRAPLEPERGGAYKTLNSGLVVPV